MAVERLNADCIECLLNKHLKGMDGLSNDMNFEYKNGIREIILNADVSMSAPEIVAQINKFKKRYGVIDDFSEIKKFYNNFLMGFENEIEAKIINADNSLQSAVKYAMAGNYIDFGVMDNVNEQALRKTLDTADKINIDKAEFEKFKSEITNAKNIVYLTDNCGEIVLDKLLIKRILSLNSSVKLNVIVRGEPVLNDCTIDDAVQVGLDKLAAVMGNGTAIAGTALDKISPQAKQIIDNADIIISKGQGNFETLHHCGKNVYYLFLCKCDMFAKRFGVEKFSGVFINDCDLI